MIVLDGFDPHKQRAFLHNLSLPARSYARSVDGVRRILDAMGVDDIELVDAEPEGELLDHRWSVYDEKLHYHVRFPLLGSEAAAATDYLALALATSGIADEDGLIQARLALHELAANVLEHGTPLAPDSVLHIRLAFDPNTLDGVLHDECEPFNPLLMDPLSIRERLELRARRGYGVEIARRLMDDLRYRRLETGNELRYRKLFGELAGR